jgi:transitional endoplasmic reticulum ATPase
VGRRVGEGGEGYLPKSYAGGADLASVCNEAVMLAIREYVLAGKPQEDEEIAKYRIKAKHFEEALKKVKPSKKEKESYSKFAEIA